MGLPFFPRRLPLARASRALVGILLGVGSVAVLAAAPPPVPNEYQVKAAALYNIIAFTDWPDAATSSDAPLIIAVFGRGPIAGEIADLIQKESWRGRQLVLLRNPALAEARKAQVVFVSRTEQARWPFLRSQFVGRAVLTVGDSDDFAAQAGMVQFSIERNRLRLTVNLAAARAARLQISSKVLRLAAVIDGGEQ